MFFCLLILLSSLISMFLRFRQVNHLVEEEIKTTAKLTAKRSSNAAVRDQFLLFATFPTHLLSRYRLNTVDDITSLSDPWEKGDWKREMEEIKRELVVWGGTEQDTREERERELWVGNFFNRRKFRVFKGLSIDTIQFVIKKGLVRRGKESCG
jgi:hypothetical protein